MKILSASKSINFIQFASRKLILMLTTKANILPEIMNMELEQLFFQKKKNHKIKFISFIIYTQINTVIFFTYILQT